MNEPMSPTMLAAALELSRLHGVPYAAFFLLDHGVSSEVIEELLIGIRPKLYYVEHEPSGVS
jgi:hypothetical protein